MRVSQGCFGVRPGVSAVPAFCATPSGDSARRRICMVRTARSTCQEIITEVLTHDKALASRARLQFGEFWRAIRRQKSMPAMLSHPRHQAKNVNARSGMNGRRHSRPLRMTVGRARPQNCARKPRACAIAVLQQTKAKCANKGTDAFCGGQIVYSSYPGPP